MEGAAAQHPEPFVIRSRVTALLLRLAVGEERHGELHSDLADLEGRRAARFGRAYARRRYWQDVFSLLVSGRMSPAHDSQPPRAKGAFMSALLFDVNHALRTIRRRPAFFATAAATLAIGFAAHLSAFTVVDRMLLAPAPHVKNPGSIVRLHIDRADPRASGRFLWFQTPYRSYLDLRQGSGFFSAMAAYRPATASVNSGAEARQLSIVFADEHYFALLGATPQIGRLFDARENQPPSATPVIVISDGYWRAAHGSDPQILGKPLRIGATTFTVIGVMPKHFAGDGVEPVDAWSPIFAGAADLPPTWTTSYLYRSVTVLARLQPGLSRSAAADAASAHYRRTVEGTPAADATSFAVLSSILPGRAQRGELNRAGKVAVWVEGVAILVLLVALANVVNLQMSRAAEQRREMAVRVALGASRGRLLFRLALELGFIAAAGGAAGFLLARLSATSLLQLVLPGGATFANPWRLAAMAAIAVIAATLICFLLSALHIRVGDVNERLKTGRGGDGFKRERLRQTLLVVQVVVSAVLLVGAGLFLRSIDRLGRLDYGHDHERVLVVTSPMAAAGYSAESIERFYRRALETVPSLPGVAGVAAAQSTPFAPSQAAVLALPGVEGAPLLGERFPTFYTVTPGFFETMGMKVLRGRGFTDSDRAGAPPVMVLEEALAQALWPNENAVGKCIIVGTQQKDCREVVGIVSNTRRFVATGTGALRYYLPMAQRLFDMPPQALFVKTEREPLALAPTVRSALLGLDGNLPYIRMRSLTEMSEPEKRPWRMGSTLFVVFGAAALLVATAGVYALLSFMVAQRTREIAVRLALGATRGRTIRLIVRQTLVWVAGGLVVGLVVALASGKFVEPMLFETSAYDVTVFAVTAVLLLLVAIAASLAPALRASRVDPNTALRVD